MFNFSKKTTISNNMNQQTIDNTAELAKIALNSITDGVIMIDAQGVIKMANPAAVAMLNQKSADMITGLNCATVLKLENSEGLPIVDDVNPILLSLKNNEPFSSRDYLLAGSQNERQMAIALTIVPTSGIHNDRIITFRNITKELEEEGAQMEFISTASHEMRTPVASIEGYLALALNPQTATIDARAQQYLTSAHQASKHLGDLFRDLLDVTKMDDGKLKPYFVPVDIVKVTREIADGHMPMFQKKHLKYSFGTPDSLSVDAKRSIDQIVYCAVDMNFLREIIDNLIENAIKYTKEGGSVWVNARGDGDKVLLNVTDTGIGINPDDLTHIFQKFYRVNNSQTQTVGGTGLGLYLVKTRVEAMGGRIWAESGFGEGTTFYVSLPRISTEEYQKRQLILENERAKQAFAQHSAQQQAPMSVVQPQAASPPVNLVQPNNPIINQPQGGQP